MQIDTPLVGRHYSLAHVRVVNIGMYPYADLDLTVGDWPHAPARPAGLVGLVGKNGHGKSTIMDSMLIALQDDRSLVLNGAATKGTSSRGRRGGGRSVGSLVRGTHYTTTTDESARLRGVSLRDPEANQWGAAVDVFLSDDGAACSFGKFIYVPARASDETYHTLYLWSDGEIDPRDAAAVAARKFTPTSLAETFPSAHVTEHYAPFLEELTRRMGWSSPDASRRNLALLAMIQRGESIRTCDEAVRRIGLDVPRAPKMLKESYHEATESLRNYRQCQETLEKVKRLEAIGSLHDELVESTEGQAKLEALRPDADGPFALWASTRQAELAHEHLATSSAAASSAEERVASAEREKSAATQRLRAAQDALDRHGNPVDTLRNRLEDANRILSRVSHDLDEADRLFGRAQVAPRPTTRPAFEAFQERRESLREAAAAAADAAAEEYDAKKADLTRLEDARKVEEDRLRQLKRGLGRLPRDLIADRRTLAESIGVSERELPFLAELIDVRPEESASRRAVAAALAGVLTTVLVEDSLWGRVAPHSEDTARYHRIDLVRATRDVPPPTGVEGRVSGLLDYDSSREADLTGWLASYVSSPDLDALVVRTSAEAALAGELAASLDGALYDGDHIRMVGKDADIFGFDNTAAIEDCEAQIADIDSRIAAENGERRRLSREQADASRRAEALAVLSRYSWGDIDIDSARDAVDALKAEIDRAMANNEYGRLVRTRDEARDEQQAKTEEVARAVADRDRAKADLADASKVAKAHDAALTRLEGAGVTVTDAQRAELDALAEAPGATARERLTAFTATSRQLRTALRSRLEAERAHSSSLRDRMANAMAQFTQAYPESGRMLGTDPDKDYAPYGEMLAHLSAAKPREGLRATLESFVPNAAATLGQIASRYRDEVDDVRRRIEPINEMLATIPFGDYSGRLSLKQQRVTRELEDAALARIEPLAHLALQGVSDLEDAELKAKYEEIIDLFKELHDTSERSSRKFLDAREAWRFTVRVDFPEGVDRQTEVVDSYGSYSGGESEELSIFTMGAILRYRMSNDGMNEPTLRTVLLDEACLKSDLEHTERSVAALRSLGFQVVTASPMERTELIEQMADKLVLAAKNPEGTLCRLVDIRLPHAEEVA